MSPHVVVIAINACRLFSTEAMWAAHRDRPFAFACSKLMKRLCERQAPRVENRAYDCWDHWFFNHIRRRIGFDNKRL